MGRIAVRVTPRARDDSISGWQGDSLRVRFRAIAEEGKANEAVCRLIANALRVPPSSISLTRGATSRGKLLEVAGLDDEEIRRRLGGT